MFSAHWLAHVHARMHTHVNAMYTDDQLLHHTSIASYLNALKYVLKGPWDDPPLGCRLRHPLHGERFATSSLSISEDGSMVALGDPLSAEGGGNRSQKYFVTALE